MGNESSREPSPEAEESSSSITRLKERLHLHGLRRHLHLRHSQRSGSSSALRKLLHADHFAGIALLTLRRAEMKFKDKWLACVSFGEQTFRTEISDQTDKPVWNSEKKLLLEKDGPHVARISVFETNKVSSNKLIGYCEINLLEYLTQIVRIP